MFLSYGIAVTLGFLTVLSSLMIGLGQGDCILPTLMFVAAVSSFYLVEYRRVIQLGDWTVNVLIMLIVFFTIGEIVHNRGEDLALAIAHVLTFAEVVLLFRAKRTDYCWQILLLSLLQVLVATAFQQSILFAFLLISYVFIGLFMFLLIFLQSEHSYFQSHSFVGTFIANLKSEIRERADRGRIVRIALLTLFTGPLSLVFTFSDSEKKKRRNEFLKNRNLTVKEVLRSLFAVFPNEEEQSNRWEAVSETEVDEKYFAPVPIRMFRSLHLKNSKARFSLLMERPSFAAGTMTANGAESIGEVILPLVKGMFFALIFAAAVFCLTPRLGHIEINGYAVKLTYNNWQQSFFRPVNAVGFSDTVRLGSLGNVMMNHREVISVRFIRYEDKQLPRRRDYTPRGIPYTEICGQPIYFQGVALDRYYKGLWTQQEEQVTSNNTGREILRFFQTQEDIPPAWYVGSPVRSSDCEYVFFQDDTDLVALLLTIQPLDTTVFFAPHPFFTRFGPEQLSLSATPTGVREHRERHHELRTTIYTTAFNRGAQLEITPCQEFVFNPSVFLDVPDKGLDGLKSLAKQWDDESCLPKSDIIGRAKFVENKLRNGNFRYQLGGMIRDYGVDPLEDFVTTHPKGHCEFFAGALVLMLRSVGIGSRLIAGYKTETAASAHEVTTIRQSDAHTWVHVYLPPQSIREYFGRRYYDKRWFAFGGWLRLDPTPSSERTTSDVFSADWTDFQEWIHKFWGTFVLNMDSAKQKNWIYEPLQETAWNFWIFCRDKILYPDFWQSVPSEIWNYYKELLLKNSPSKWMVRDWFFLVSPLIIVLLMFYPLAKITFWLWEASRKTRQERQGTAGFYLRLEKLLATLGTRRQQSETPLELIGRCEFQSFTQPIVDAFYRTRFGGATLSRDELRSMQMALDVLERNVKERVRLR